MAAVRTSALRWPILTLFALVLTTCCNGIRKKNDKGAACALMRCSIHCSLSIIRI